MPLTELTCERLFGYEGCLAEALLKNCPYPWDAVRRIGEFVTALGEMLLKSGGWRDLGGGAVVSENAEVSPMAVIYGPCVIAAGAEIRPGAYIRGNVLVEEGCVVGNSTELKNALLLKGAKLPHFNYAGDSVVGRSAHMGAGAVASNFKLDGSEICVAGIKTGRKKLGAALGDGAEIGCHCVLDPGTVIGKNSAVYPGTVVRGVVPEGRIVKSAKEIVGKR